MIAIPKGNDRALSIGILEVVWYYMYYTVLSSRQKNAVGTASKGQPSIKTSELASHSKSLAALVVRKLEEIF